IDTMTDWYGWMFVLRRPYIPAANSRSGLLAAHTAVPSDAWTASSDPWPKAIGAPTRPTDRPKCRPLARSEEHTSELQSLMRISYAVFCLKKKKTNTQLS